MIPEIGTRLRGLAPLGLFPATLSLHVEPPQPREGDTVRLYGQLFDPTTRMPISGAQVTVWEQGRNVRVGVTLTGDDGNYLVTLVGHGWGQYDYIATYDGDEAHDPASSGVTTFFTKAKTWIALSQDKFEGKTGEAVIFRARLFHGQNPLVGKVLRVVAGDVTGEALTGADGSAEHVVPLRLPGFLRYRVEYGGSNEEEGSFAQSAVAVDVAKIDTALTWQADKSTTENEPFNLTGQLLTQPPIREFDRVAGGAGRAQSDARVIIWLLDNGVGVASVPVEPNGTFSFEYLPNAIGPHVLRALFSGAPWRDAVLVPTISDPIQVERKPPPGVLPPPSEDPKRRSTATKIVVGYAGFLGSMGAVASLAGALRRG